MTSKKNICPWCGIANPEEAVQCIGCGSDLHAGPSSSEQAPASAMPEPAVPPVQGGPVKQAAAKPKANTAAKSNSSQPKKVRRQSGTNGIQPGMIYAAIAAVVILGYLYLKGERTEPTVPQNTSFMQEDSSAQRLGSMEEFLASHPKDKEATLSYANMLHDARQFPKAIGAYKNFLALDPKNADARVDMAICLFESGDSPTAIVELKKALEYEPKHQPAMFNLGVVYLNQEKAQESNDWFSRCVAVDPGTPIAARAKQLLSQHSSTNNNLK